jgi:hypothetical protein
MISLRDKHKKAAFLQAKPCFFYWVKSPDLLKGKIAQTG